MLILTDRSRQEEHHKQCMRARWWKYHSHDGYGISAKAAQLEASIGIAVHLALAEVLKLVQIGGQTAQDMISPDLFSKGPLVLAKGERRTISAQEAQARTQARESIQSALRWFEGEFRRTGMWFGEGGDRSEHEYILREQMALIEGLFWGWLRGQFPNFMQTFRVMDVEREECWIEGCDCGARPVGGGNPILTAHDGNDCSGVGHMARPDIVLVRLSDGLVGIHDFKTMKSCGEYDINRYRVSVQMAANTLAVEARIGQPVTHYYIHVLLKGSRSNQYTPETKTFSGPKRRLSPYCYNEYLAPAPPLRPSDELGASNLQWYKRSPTWEVSFAHKPEEWTQAEYLVSLMTLPEVQKNFLLVGPYERQGWLCKRYMVQMAAEERRWLERVWAVYDMVQAGRDIEDALDEVVPQSWDCMKYGSEGGQCEFLPLCLGEGASPRDPMGSGLYVPRVPHHEYEFERKRKQGG